MPGPFQQTKQRLAIAVGHARKLGHQGAVDGCDAGRGGKGEQRGRIGKADDDFGVCGQLRAIDEGQEAKQAVTTAREEHRLDDGIAQGRLQLMQALLVGAGEKPLGAKQGRGVVADPVAQREQARAGLEIFTRDGARRGHDADHVARARGAGGAAETAEKQTDATTWARAAFNDGRKGRGRKRRARQPRR